MILTAIGSSKGFVCSPFDADWRIKFNHLSWPAVQIGLQVKSSVRAQLSMLTALQQDDHGSEAV